MGRIDWRLIVALAVYTDTRVLGRLRVEHPPFGPARDASHRNHMRVHLVNDTQLPTLPYPSDILTKIATISYLATSHPKPAAGKLGENSSCLQHFRFLGFRALSPSRPIARRASMATCSWWNVRCLALSHHVQTKLGRQICPSSSRLWPYLYVPPFCLILKYLELGCRE